MRELLLGDVHARWDKVRKLMRLAGVLDEHDVRVPNTRVYQLGDAVSLGYNEAEYEFIVWFAARCDVMLVGNHEAPHIHFSLPNFQGWQTADLEAVKVVRDLYWDEGRYDFATTIGPWLITHAGLAQKYLRQMEGMTVEEIAAEINSLGHGFVRSAATYGEGPALIARAWNSYDDGVLWLRIWHLQNDYGSSDRHVPQIVGHTPLPEYAPKEIVKGRLWCIDSPAPAGKIHGGVSGLVTDDGGQTWDLIHIPADEELLTDE